MKSKRFAFFLLAFVFAVLLQTAVSGANAGLLVLSPDKETLSRGEDFTVAVDMPRNPGFIVMRLQLDYDREILELIDAKDLSLIPGALFTDHTDTDKFYLYWTNNTARKDYTATGHLAELHFRVRADALLHDTVVSLKFETTNWDILNAKDQQVTFDCAPISLHLPCDHPNAAATVLTPATPNEKGKQSLSCPDCGEVWEEEIPPQVVGDNGKTAVQFPAEEAPKEQGTYLATTEYIFGGAEFEAAQAQFGARLRRLFRVHLSRDGKEYTPAPGSTVELTCSFLPQESQLFVKTEAGYEEVSYTRRGDVLHFPYSGSFFAFLSEEEELPEEKDVPSSSEKPAPTAPASSAAPLTPQEENRRETWLTLVIGGAVVLLCAIGAFFLLRRKKSDL